MSSVFKPFIFAVALGLLGWYLSKVEWENLLHTLSKLGPWAPLILVPYTLVYLVDCLAWAQTLPAKVGFWTLFRIRWAGECVNNTIPSGYIGGEAVKVWLLRTKKGVSGSQATLSVVVSKTAQTVAQVVFITAASVVFLMLAHDRSGLRTGLMVMLCGAFTAVAGMFWIQRLGFYRFALRLARLLRPVRRWVEQHAEKLQKFDSTILHFYRHERPRFYRSTMLFLCGWLLDTLEIYLVAYLLEIPISWPQALVIEAFAGVAKMAGMWVPGSLGVQESGIVVLARLVGAPHELGVAYALIRRVRDVIFAAAGWFFLHQEGTLRKIRNDLSVDAAKAPLTLH